MTAARLFWLTVGWLLAATIAVGLYLRWTPQTRSATVGAASLTPLVFIAVIGLLVAVWRLWDRRYALGAIVLTVAYLATFVSIDSVIGCGPTSAEDEIVVYTHNVWGANGDPTAVAGAVVAVDADVIVLQEVWQDFLNGLAANPALDGHLYRTSEPAQDSTGLAVWSRYPISDATVIRLTGSVPALRTTIDGPTGSFSLDAIHTTAPVAGGFVSDWEAQLAELGALEQRGPSVMAGDFNATMDHSQFRDLVGRGWIDTHEPKGCGFDATWPTNRGLPTLLRLDHVLVSPDFEVLAVEIGDGAGSDHRSVAATIRLRTPTP